MDDNAVFEVAQAFVEARRNGAILSEFPGQRPQSLTEAYHVQNAAIKIWNRQVGGWKVGRIPEPAATRYEKDRLAGPIFTDLIKSESADLAHFPIFHGGFAAAEAEFALRLGEGCVGTIPATNEEAAEMVDAICIAVEIASSPYARINEDGPLVTVSDHGNNNGLLLGQAVAQGNWSELDSIEVAMNVDGKKVGSATTATMLDGPFGAVRFLLENLAERGIAAEPGSWISSGAITGVHPVMLGSRVVASFEGLGQVELTIADPGNGARSD
ncbi:MAG: fumarylacetoacetate hydrolase family protein [Marinomonas sp.]